MQLYEETRRDRPATVSSVRQLVSRSRSFSLSPKRDVAPGTGGLHPCLSSPPRPRSASARATRGAGERQFLYIQVGGVGACRITFFAINIVETWGVVGESSCNH